MDDDSCLLLLNDVARFVTITVRGKPLSTPRAFYILRKRSDHDVGCSCDANQCVSQYGILPINSLLCARMLSSGKVQSFSLILLNIQIDVCKKKNQSLSRRIFFSVDASSIERIKSLVPCNNCLYLICIMLLKCKIRMRVSCNSEKKKLPYELQTNFNRRLCSTLLHLSRDALAMTRLQKCIYTCTHARLHL